MQEGKLDQPNELPTSKSVPNMKEEIDLGRFQTIGNVFLMNPEAGLYDIQKDCIPILDLNRALTVSFFLGIEIKLSLLNFFFQKGWSKCFEDHRMRCYAYLLG